MTSQYPFRCRTQRPDMRPEPFKGFCSTAGSHNNLSHPLVAPNKILLLPLHRINEELCEGNGFAFLQKFPWITIEKLKAGIFNSHQIRELMKKPMLDEALSKVELSTWLSMKTTVTNFLGNLWSLEYKKEIEELLKSVHELRAQMSVKLLFLQSHLDYFANCGDLSKE